MKKKKGGGGDEEEEEELQEGDQEAQEEAFDNCVDIFLLLFVQLRGEHQKLYYA